ncbi:MAG: pyruvate synthase subunit beta [Candidatus Diapherotrites archaeon]|nr:pyruvate synthase subunit beta [Candidatus Diapherotrites archaeon]
MGLPREEYIASGHRACAGCGEILTIRHVLKASGKNTIVVNATGCAEVVTTPYPQTAWKIPWVHSAFENIAAVASGIDKGLECRGIRDKINLLAIGGDGASFDIGFGSLSGAIERGHKFTYIATDNEAYMNTGIQRSGATPLFANTTTSPAGKKIHGKIEPKKPLPLIVAAHGVSYVATISIADLPDLYAKVKKALKAEVVSFLHAFCPCVPGWKYPSSKTIEIAKKATATGVFPLYEIENGILKFTRKPAKLEPVNNYLKMQGRFKHLSQSEIRQIQNYVKERYNFLLSVENSKCFDTLFK